MIKWKLVDCGPDGLRPWRVYASESVTTAFIHMRVRALWDQIKERARMRGPNDRTILVAIVILLGMLAVKMSEPSPLGLAQTIPIPPELTGF